MKPSILTGARAGVGQVEEYSDARDNVARRGKPQKPVPQAKVKKTAKGRVYEMTSPDGATYEAVWQFDREPTPADLEGLKSKIKQTHANVLDANAVTKDVGKFTKLFGERSQSIGPRDPAGRTVTNAEIDRNELRGRGTVDVVSEFLAGPSGRTSKSRDKYRAVTDEFMDRATSAGKTLGGMIGGKPGEFTYGHGAGAIAGTAAQGGDILQAVNTATAGGDLDIRDNLALITASPQLGAALGATVNAGAKAIGKKIAKKAAAKAVPDQSVIDLIKGRTAVEPPNVTSVADDMPGAKVAADAPTSLLTPAQRQAIYKLRDMPDALQDFIDKMEPNMTDPAVAEAVGLAKKTMGKDAFAKSRGQDDNLESLLQQSIDMVKGRKGQEPGTASPVGDGAVAPVAGGSLFKGRAIEHLGTTKDVREAGYVLDDGQMLDFSGKRQGGQSGVRYMDHRDLPSEMEIGAGSATERMHRFMKDTGAVRVSHQNGILTVDYVKPLTPTQMAWIERQGEGMSVVIEATNPSTGYPLKSFEFDGASKKQITGAMRKLNTALKDYYPDPLTPDAHMGLRGGGDPDFYTVTEQNPQGPTSTSGGGAKPPSDPPSTAQGASGPDFDIEGVGKKVKEKPKGPFGKGLAFVDSAFATMREAVATGDLSFPGIQGSLAALTDTKAWMSGLKTSVASYAKLPYEQAMAKIAADVDFEKIKATGVDLPGVGGATDEVFQNSPLQKAPLGIGKAVKASARSYDGGATATRYYMVKSHIAMAEAMNGGKPLSPESLKVIGDAVNTMTGRASSGLGRVVRGVDFGRGLFAPSYWVSLFEAGFGKPLLQAIDHGKTTGEWGAAKLYARKSLRGVAAATSVLATAKIALESTTDWKVELDPRSPLGGKAYKVQNGELASVDLLPPQIGQPWRFLAIFAGGKKDIEGKVDKSMYGRMQAWQSLLEGKMAPGPKLGMNIRDSVLNNDDKAERRAAGKVVDPKTGYPFGKDYDPREGEGLKNLGLGSIPISAQQMKEMYESKALTWEEKVALVPFLILSRGPSSYPKDAKDTKKDYRTPIDKLLTGQNPF